MMIKIYTIEGGQKDVSSLEGTALKNIFFCWCSNLNNILVLLNMAKNNFILFNMSKLFKKHFSKFVYLKYFTDPKYSKYFIQIQIKTKQI